MLFLFWRMPTGLPGLGAEPTDPIPTVTHTVPTATITSLRQQMNSWMVPIRWMVCHSEWAKHGGSFMGTEA